MQSSIDKTDLNEEKFIILLDVMEKHFAALKLLDTSPESKAGNQAQVTDQPWRQKIQIEQEYGYQNAPKLIKQYSFEQTFDESLNIRQVKISEVLKSDDVEYRNVWNAQIPHNDNSSNFNRPVFVTNYQALPESSPQGKLEMMETDDIEDNLSLKEYINAPSLQPEIIQNDSPEKPNLLIRNEANISKNKNHSKTNYQEFKKTIRPLIPNRIKPRRIMKGSWIFFCLIPFIILLMNEVFNDSIYKYIELYSVRKFNYTVAIEKLKHKVYGQDEAINKLKNYLELENDNFKVAILVGNVGVGKSYTAKILKENLLYSDIYEYFPPLDIQDISNTFSLSRCNLIILENLKISDILNVETLIKLMKKKDICATILAIFNLKNAKPDLLHKLSLSDQKRMIMDNFMDKSVNGPIIEFVELGKDVLRKCILDEAEYINIELSNEQINEISDILENSQSGCKGAYSKVQINTKPRNDIV